MRFGSRFTGFFGGSPSSAEVPWKYHVSLNGRPYMVDTKAGTWRTRTVPLLRQQSDQGAQPSESSINPEDLWRRSHESWHHGAGQSNYDRPDSDPFRFRSSKGVDVWTKHQLSLLADTTSRKSTSATVLQALPVGSYLYVIDGTAVYHTQDITVAPTWTSADIQNGEGAQSVKSLASDGKNVYAALGSNGVHLTVRGATTTSHYSDLSCTLVGYVKGRLMAANGNAIYNVTASGAAPSALLSHPNSDFAWVGFAGGAGAIYAAGYSGDKSLVYRTAVKADGTALDVPVVAGELPDGEIVRAIGAYLGYLLLGTDKGWRLVAVDSDGDFASMSDIIPTTSAVQCFEPQDRFVWFGQSNYDSTSTGLGRADLGVFTKGLNPAYATDVMAATQGAVLTVATFQSIRIFGVSGHGYYAETTNKVTSGTMDGGLIDYGLPDTKVAIWLDVRHQHLTHGTHAAYLSVDGGTFTLIGTHAVDSPEGSFPAGQKAGETFEVRSVLTRDATTTTAGPTLTRWTLQAEPTPSRSLLITVPLMLYETLRVNDTDVPFAVEDALDEIDGLVEHAGLVSYQAGAKSVSVFVKDYEFAPEQPTEDRRAWQGVCTVLLKAPAA